MKKRIKIPAVTYFVVLPLSANAQSLPPAEVHVRNVLARSIEFKTTFNASIRYVSDRVPRSSAIVSMVKLILFTLSPAKIKELVYLFNPKE